ncbi:MAG: type IV toxin-antitoxin system AbiEi family antitoxin domain-containing protein [Lacunisphaera sp.]
MATSNKKNPIKSLASLPRGRPVDVRALRALGASSSLASHYVRSGWLVRLGRGVFMFPGDQLEEAAAVKFLGSQLPSLHVGGKTALAWRGVRHNVGPRERLVLWGNAPWVLPAWFTERFPSRYVSRGLFSESLPADFGLQPLPETPGGPAVSVPERALLELLDDVGVNQGLEEARNIMEGVRSVRLDVLGTLLEHCPRVKAVRLCLNLADELNLSWAAEARKLAGPRGRGRWVSKLPDGTTLILKP